MKSLERNRFRMIVGSVVNGVGLCMIKLVVRIRKIVVLVMSVMRVLKKIFLCGKCLCM